MDADAVLPIAGDHAWDWAGKTAVGSTLPALTGTTPWIRVPRPFDSTRSVPPTAPKRSRMLVRPSAAGLAISLRVLLYPLGSANA
jgi:hypothetical protein